jgi:CubicO group peptidase (beta-lactamase class C family)
MKLSKILCVSAVVVCSAFSAWAQEVQGTQEAQSLPKAGQPEDVGFSSERLKRLTGAFQAEVQEGAIPGAVVLVARDGKIAYLEAFGFQDREKKLAMHTDAIFRLASLTKPVTSVAVMMLVEEGKIQLDDPVSLYLPELTGLQVGVEKVNAATGKTELSLEPARRAMTVQDLLRHTSGLTYDFLGGSLVKQAYRAARLNDPEQTLAEFITKLSKLPLAHQPGTMWDYSTSTDVLGRLVEVTSGMPFDRFLAERITKPLGMADTGFYAAGDKAQRLAEPQTDPMTGHRPPMMDPTRPHAWLSGGGGLVSTASDYARFSQMLLNGGALDGVRLLSPKTVAYMTSDQLPPDITYSPEMLQFFEPRAIAPTPRDGQGFGLGFMVRTQPGRNPWPGSVGSYYWVGIFGTAFWVDPAEKLVAVMMMTVPPLQAGHYRSLIRNLVYQALVN